LAGSFAGEIRGGSATYFFGLAGGFPLIVVNYVLPIIIFYLPLPSYSGWQNNYFVEISYKMNPWYHSFHSFQAGFDGVPRLGRWMLVSASLSLFGTSNAVLASAARNIWATATPSDTGTQYLPSFLGRSSLWLRPAIIIRCNRLFFEERGWSIPSCICNYLGWIGCLWALLPKIYIFGRGLISVMFWSPSTDL
jgi:hypothetical protein